MTYKKAAGILLEEISKDSIKGAVSPLVKARTAVEILSEGGEDIVGYSATSALKEIRIDATVSCNSSASCSYYVDGNKVCGN